MLNYAFALTLRVLLFWGYHSTDFEVHRNWMSITHNLPLHSWYKDSTSQWTLDYPPFFAYFEFILSQGASLLEPEMLQISSKPYESVQCIGYQRATVIISEFILIFALYLIGDSTVSALVLLNPGLIYVDFIHFQYNGMLLGLSLLSIHLISQQKFIQGALIYTTLLLFKHIYIYYAPAFLFFYLKHYCFCSGSFSVKRLLQAGLAVSLVLLVGIFPFINQLPDLKARLFPWGRGLTHSYWAPNLWSLYNLLDSCLNFLINHKFKTEYMLGLVQICNHSVLPNITPLITFIFTVVFLVFLARFCFWSRSYQICEAVCLSALGFFLVGWHVHEKAILMAAVPALMLYSKYPELVFLLNFFASFSIFPLIFTSVEQPFVVSSFLCYFIIYSRHIQLRKVAKVYMAVAVPVYFGYMTANHFLRTESFAPLLLISIYNSIGILTVSAGFYQSCLTIKEKLN